MLLPEEVLKGIVVPRHLRWRDGHFAARARYDGGVLLAKWCRNFQEDVEQSWVNTGGHFALQRCFLLGDVDDELRCGLFIDKTVLPNLIKYMVSITCGVHDEDWRGCFAPFRNSRHCVVLPCSSHYFLA